MYHCWFCCCCSPRLSVTNKYNSLRMQSPWRTRVQSVINRLLIQPNSLLLLCTRQCYLRQFTATLNPSTSGIFLFQCLRFIGFSDPHFHTVKTKTNWQTVWLVAEPFCGLRWFRLFLFGPTLSSSKGIGTTLSVTVVTCHHHFYKWWWQSPPLFHVQSETFHTLFLLSLIHIWRCRRIERCRSRWSPYH